MPEARNHQAKALGQAVLQHVKSLGLIHSGFVWHSALYPLDDGYALTALAAHTRMQLACLMAVHSCDTTASAKPEKELHSGGFLIMQTLGITGSKDSQQLDHCI